MNTYISTILVIMSLFVFSIMAYEWGSNLIDFALGQVSKTQKTLQSNEIKEIIKNIISSGVGSKRDVDIDNIKLINCHVDISNTTNQMSFNISTIEGVDYDLYMERDTLYIFLYNITSFSNKVLYIEYLGENSYTFGGNISINYSGSVRYFYPNNSKIYIYNLVMG
ncbi:conserved hypothetical protein [Methanocaldococcus vulcanius M7]|uniref:Flagellin n=1 Tax=Methanocaldococcus vulcanius (strain ATCC 700851 / DSM 12094 / M7) TaxID=579137 RepID=C9RFM1_METVM|nr:hypothetical protein [Methanocaldococcus vulcanius]ACX72373.1 conserved hypothetical protein [Methanocaldococcus vulcanius M7]